MTDITIPPEAVEATAGVMCVADGLVPDRLRRDGKPTWMLWQELATAALRAGIAAWPGALTERRARCDAVVLPFNLDADIGVIALPTENTNAEG